MVSCRVPGRPNLSARGQGVHGWPFKAQMMYCAAATAAVANAREKASCLSAIMAVAIVPSMSFASLVTGWPVGEFLLKSGLGGFCRDGG